VIGRYAPVVNRRGLAWLLSVSLAAVGSLAAHTLGLLPHAAEGREHLEAGTQGAPHLPLLAGLSAALIITGLAHRAWSMVRRRPARLLPPGWFMAIPPLGWTLQEAAERRLGVESFPFDAAREPTFVKGLVVQLLFGVLAFLAARLLLAVAARLRRRCQAGGWPATRQAGIGITAAHALGVRPRQLVLALADYERGPPGRG
jgi:hypothetical protein